MRFFLFGVKRLDRDLIMHCHKCGGEFKNFYSKDNGNDPHVWFQDYGHFPKHDGKAYATCKVEPWSGKFNYSHLNECSLEPTKAWKFYTKKEKREAINLTITTLVILIIIIGFCIWVFG